MELSPRYGADPVIVLDGDPAGIAAPVVGQRRRMLAALEQFDDDQWAQPSRCAGWSNRDVAEHLAGTNAFWVHSIEAGRRGEPSRMLAGFDPAATPAQMVADAAELTSAQVLERFATSTARLIDTVEAIDGEEWSVLAEAPPGHLTVSAVVHHALWDSWIHERDILLPLGDTPVADAHEVTACLRYAVALAPAVGILLGDTRRGRMQVTASDPDISFEVSVSGRVEVRDATSGSGDTGSDLTLAGGAVELVEAISVRRPFDEPLPEASAWMVNGLRTAFG